MTVEAPASSANLGPGFDALALALDLHLRVTITPLDHGAEQLRVEGEGATEIGLDAGNRFLIGLERGLQEFGREPPVMRIEMHNEIPLARGLGSSAAACVCGLRAAEALAGAELGAERLLRLATRIDGHPDNVGAAIMGGFVVVARGDGGRGNVAAGDAVGNVSGLKDPRAMSLVRVDPPADLVAALFIPDMQLRTEQMRAALPTTVAHADAAHNVARTALVVAAFSAGRLDLLWAMGEDRLHEPYRVAHFVQLPDLLAAARAAGALGAALSGAGSTVIALCDDASVAESAAQAMAKAGSERGLTGRGVVVRPTAAGVRLLDAQSG